MTVLYFTATGNNLYVAKRIGGDILSIPKAIKEGNDSFSDDKIGLVFPIFGVSVPAIIEEFLKNISLQSEYIFAVMSYGMYSGAAASHLVEIGIPYGIGFSYINTIKMVDNYLPNFYMEKQIASEYKKKIEENLERIITDIGGARKYVHKDSGLDRLMTNRYRKAGVHRTGGLCEKFYIEDVCTRCSICVSVCPVDNVRLQGEKPDFEQHCINCLACIHACPNNAIHFNGEKSRVRFRNQHIDVKEIISANE